MKNGMKLSRTQGSRQEMEQDEMKRAEGNQPAMQ